MNNKITFCDVLRRLIVFVGIPLLVSWLLLQPVIYDVKQDDLSWTTLLVFGFSLYFINMGYSEAKKWYKYELCKWLNQRKEHN